MLDAAGTTDWREKLQIFDVVLSPRYACAGLNINRLLDTTYEIFEKKLKKIIKIMFQISFS